MFQSTLFQIARWCPVSLAFIFVGCGPPDRVVDEPESIEPVAQTASTRSTDDPSGDKPVSFSAEVNPDHSTAGDVVTLAVHGKIAERWHIYAASGPTGVAQPTKLELTLPETVSVAADWSLPAAETSLSPEGPISIYEGDVRFNLPLTIAQDAPAATIMIQCDIRYQACDDSRCLPPTSATLTVPLTIAPKKGP